ncbi:hypothetical protein GCM10027610_126160 [Dactylosporangium cerinum]
MSSYQASSAQLSPDQAADAHVFDAHEVPVQASPAIRRPIQTPPFHAVPLRVSCAQTAGLNPPKMSNSPTSCWLSCTTWLLPRADSSEPTPADVPAPWTVVGVAAFTAAARLSSPTPPARGVAVLFSRALTWSGVRVGRFCRSRARPPETTAAAWELPLPRKNLSPTRAPG